ncbi:MAG: M20/M25/M40 family metallo-hydrolase, partial [Planctomycetes bacterium]|nr:M20/M25/M40 family metallo-hydrolase [Planctomycetota bacterium]
MSRTLPAFVIALLAAACASPDPMIAARVAEVDQARLMRHVESLCALGPRPESHTQTTAATLAYLEQELRSYGLEVRRHTFSATMRTWTRKRADDGSYSFVLGARPGVHHNLIAEKRGARATAVELGAHYDTVVFGPGADDNTSGVALALEVARLVAAVPTGKTIRIVFFAMEEEGKVGSREYVEQLARDGDLPEGAIVVDGIGCASDEPGSQRR